ncbi:MAG: membrane fusion protein (multidrug efflux system) [Sulfitobacter sp.]
MNLFEYLRHHTLLIIAAVVVLGISAWSVETYISNQNQSKERRGGGAVAVVAAEVSLQEFIDQVESIGTALANESVSITAKVTETVTKVNFEDGMYVKAGDVLVELTNAEETAMLNETKANVAEATRQFERVQNLIKQKLAAETQLDVERARMQTAEARLDVILARLDDRLIRAPFSGKLGFRNVSPGTLLSPNVSLTTLDDISSIKLDFTLPESYLAAIEPGQEVIALSIAYPGLSFIGSVTTIDSRIDPNTRTIKVRAKLNNDELLLRPGMLLTVRLIQERQQFLAIPESAVMPVQNKQFAYLIIDGKAERREFEEGRRIPGFVEVRSGLKAGEQVITEGVIKIRPGSTVRVKNAMPLPDEAIAGEATAAIAEGD